MNDHWGKYDILTGHEAPNRCFWCGGEAKGRRYCCGEHRDEYHRHFFWFAAAPWCLERYGHKCADCGDPANRVHHIVPLNGEPRWVNIKNRPENLVALCAPCHGKRHAAPAKEGKLEKVPRDRFEEAIKQGQLVLLEV